MTELFRRFPFAIILSVVSHVGIAAMLFVVLENQPAEEQVGDDNEIILAELITSTDLQEEMQAMLATLDEPVIEEPIIEQPKNRL